MHYLPRKKKKDDKTILYSHAYVLIYLIVHRSLLEMFHQMQMNLQVSLWSTFSWSTIQITISLIRFVPEETETMFLYRRTFKLEWETYKEPLTLHA